MRCMDEAYLHRLSPRQRGRPRTGIVKNSLPAGYLEYHWNGQGIEAVFEVNHML